jgi:hypothetical protein
VDEVGTAAGREFANEHDGRSYPVHHLDSTAIADDPDHSAGSVDLQIDGGAMSGFFTSFADTLSRRGVQSPGTAPNMDTPALVIPSPANFPRGQASASPRPDEDPRAAADDPGAITPRHKTRR